MGKNHILADGPIDIIAMFITMIAIISLARIYNAYLGAEVSLSDASKGELIQGIEGIMLIGFAKMVAVLWRPSKRQNPNQSPKLIGVNFDFLRDSLLTVGAIASNILIEYIMSLIENGLTFQTNLTDDIYKFYFDAAVMEENLYRGGILVVAQLLIARACHLNSKKHWGASIPAILISAFWFMWSHRGVYGTNQIAMITTLLIGISEGFWMVINCNLWSIILAHAAVNMRYKFEPN